MVIAMPAIPGKTYYKRGDHWLISDRSGKQIRASEARREWNGSVVHKDEWEARHPQEFVRSVADRQTVENPRPRPTDLFIGPLKTEINATHAAGETTVTVVDSTRFLAGDTVDVMLDDGDTVRLTISSVPSGTSITFVTALPGAVSAGQAVVNYSAVSSADLG